MILIAFSFFLDLVNGLAESRDHLSKTWGNSTCALGHQTINDQLAPSTSTYQRSLVATRRQSLASYGTCHAPLRQAFAPFVCREESPLTPYL